jgi:hypothetical protein
MEATKNILTVTLSDEELHELYSADLIVEGRARGIVVVDGNTFVVTSSWSGGYRKAEFKAQRCIPLSQRGQQDPEPTTYGAKCAELDRGQSDPEKQVALRNNLYVGIVVRHKGDKWLMLEGTITITGSVQPKTAKQEQLTLF